MKTSMKIKKILFIALLIFVSNVFIVNGASTSGSGSASVNINLPTCTLSATPSSVVSGGSSVIKWVAKSVISCSLNGTVVDLGNPSINSGPLTANKNYSMSCSGVASTGTSCVTNVTVTAPLAPDVTVGAPTQSAATIGVPMTFSSIVSNVGNKTTSVGFDNIFDISTTASNAGIISTIASTPSLMGALNAGSSATATSVFYTFSGAPGTYYVRARADRDVSMSERITESNETNNFSTWASVSVSAPVFNLPSISTLSSVTNLTQNSATGGGNISSNGGTAVTVSGLVWSTTANPTISLSSKTTNGWAIGGPWTSSITGLLPNTLYHYRAYATNAVGTAYGADVTFTTSSVASSPTGTLTATDCIIDMGGNSCNTNLVWNTINPIGTSEVTTPTNIKLATANSSAGTSYSVGYGSRSFYLYNNSVELTSAISTASCTSGTIWDGSSCVKIIITPDTGLTATPSQIIKGESSTLDWYALNAVSCEGINFNTGNNVNGSISVSPTVTTTYSIICTSAGGIKAESQAIVTVTVTDPNTDPTKKPIFKEI